MPMTVKQVAEISGVSVRTLHYYDEIGLLRPSSKSEAGYRLYGDEALVRLQQVLFYREIGLPLKKIGRILDDPRFDIVQALRAHRRELTEQRERLRVLVTTIDRTLQAMEGGIPMQADRLFEGFGKKAVEENERKYGEEIRRRYGNEAVDKSNAIVAGLNRGEYEALEKEGEQIYKALSGLMHLSPDAPKVQEAITRFAAHIRRFGEYPDKALVGLGDMYVEDERFRAFYEKIAPGLAEFIRGVLHARFEE